MESENGGFVATMKVVLYADDVIVAEVVSPELFGACLNAIVKQHPEYLKVPFFTETLAARES